MGSDNWKINSKGIESLFHHYQIARKHMGKNAIPEPFIGIFPENIWQSTPLLKKKIRQTKKKKTYMGKNAFT